MGTRKRAISYRYKCELCGETVACGPHNKARHYQKFHPEIQYKSVRISSGLKQIKTEYTCSLCDNLTHANGYFALVSHYKLLHSSVLKPGSPIPIKADPPNNPIDSIDNFFGGLNDLITEVKQLRLEKREWQLKALRWSKKVIEIQELFSKRD